MIKNGTLVSAQASRKADLLIEGEKIIKVGVDLEDPNAEFVDAKGKYVMFARGPATKRLGQAPEGVGIRAEGWNICVADVTATNRWAAITTDGNCNKEPDWVPVTAP